MIKLLNIQRDLKAPKSQYNSFGKYNYRNCEDILEAVKPLCAREKACLTLSDEVVQVGDRYYVRATAGLYDCETGELIRSVQAYAREEAEKKGMDGSQVTGAASSYARKYALNGLFDIDDTKDADSDEKGAQPAKSGTGAAKAQPAGKQPSGEPKPAPKPAAAPKITYEKACDMTFEKGGRKYRLGDLSNEWLVKALKNDAYTAMHPYIEVILDGRETDIDKTLVKLIEGGESDALNTTFTLRRVYPDFEVTHTVKLESGIVTQQAGAFLLYQVNFKKQKTAEA